MTAHDIQKLRYLDVMERLDDILPLLIAIVDCEENKKTRELWDGLRITIQNFIDGKEDNI